MTIEQYGYRPDGTVNIQSVARVTAVHRGRYELVAENKLFGKLRSNTYYEGDELFPTVGDFVTLELNPTGDSIIERTLPRRSLFVRREPGPIPRAQAVAANFDYVFITTSLNRDFNPNRISRYLTMARQSGGIPVIILTKADLAEDYSAQLKATRLVAPDIDIIAVSSLTGQGMDTLSYYLKPKNTIVLLGMSGVGKSSLLNAMAGEDLMEVKEIREGDSRGRHTTTHRQLFALPCGTMVIDTPGMRLLGLWEAEEGFSDTFGEVEGIIKKCRFSDCKHKTEPDCAVQEALHSGTLTQKQWQSYQNQLRETAFEERKQQRKEHRMQKSGKR